MEDCCEHSDVHVGSTTRFENVYIVTEHTKLKVRSLLFRCPI
jgi:hypothetical protein